MHAESTKAGGVFTVECVGADGQMKWSESFHNLVVNTGLQEMNNKFFAGSSYTAALYMGLVEGPGAGNTYAAADTLASHAGWAENTDYSGDRKLLVFGAATAADPSVISNSASPASFSMNATVDIAGAFLCTTATGTAGILFSVGNFSLGDKGVDSGDTLNVTYTFSTAAA
jgi:hypothetical protein